MSRWSETTRTGAWIWCVGTSRQSDTIYSARRRPLPYPGHIPGHGTTTVIIPPLPVSFASSHSPCPAAQTTGCDPNKNKINFLFEAGEMTMKLLKGAYSCLALVKGVGLVAFRDPNGIRWGRGG